MRPGHVLHGWNRSHRHYTYYKCDRFNTCYRFNGRYNPYRTATDFKLSV